MQLAELTPWEECILLDFWIDYAEDSSGVGEEGVAQGAGVGVINFTGPAPFVDVSGPIQADGSFLAEGRGNLLFLQDVAVQMEGTLAGGRILATYTIGPGNSLPMNMQLDFDIAVAVDEWDGAWDEIGERLIEAGQDLSELSLTAPIGGVDAAAFSHQIGAQMILAGTPTRRSKTSWRRR